MQKTLGMKFDSEKARMGLLPPHALESVAEVLTFGAKKYQPNNWKYVENAHARYIDAAMRHINAYVKGEVEDPESGLPHMSHAICCLMFIADLDLTQHTRISKMSTIGKLVQEDLAKQEPITLDKAMHAMIKVTQ